MNSRTILIVEDEQAISDMIAYNLRRHGFVTRQVSDCRAARHAIADQRPDVLLMDWMLPDGSGLELTRELKRDPATHDLAIIMLTARAEEGDKVAGLEGGADDYITKPFSPRELLARVTALLRRSTGDAGTGLLQVGTLRLDRGAHRVFAGEHEVELGPTEFRLLEFLLAHPERVYSRAQLLDRVWGGNVYIDERTVDVHVRRLRAALEPMACDEYIQTVRGAGYRLSTVGVQ